MADLPVLDVMLHGRSVGALIRLGDERTLFTFNEDYIHDPGRPTLGLRFKDTFGELITEFRSYRVRLMPFFSNLLPEGHLRKYLAERAGVHPDREFFLLWALGQDLPGAVRIGPADMPAWPPDDVVADTGGMGGRGAEQGMLRFSLAGVQLKFSAVADSVYGLTIPARGVGGDWIVKLPSREYPGVPENEFSMMTLARMVGVSVPAIDLVDMNSIGNLPEHAGHPGGKAFAIERFDRSGGEGVHIEDFAQVFDVYAANKYRKASFRNIAEVIAAESGTPDIAEFIRRLTFSTLIGNGDMHLKNWSLIYPDGRNARLSPAYDLVSTIPYIPNESSALTFSRSRDFDAFTDDELLHLSARASLPRGLVLDTAHETVERFMENWAREKRHLPMGGDVLEAIDRHLAALPILQGNR